jgi:Predicted nucleotide-binding protein containing TIR-like domain
MEIIRESQDIFPALKELIDKTQTKFVAMGVSFFRSLSSNRRSIEAALDRGVEFRYITLDPNASLDIFSRQFGQTIEELRNEIHHSEAILNKFSIRYKDQFSYYPTKRCPNYRIYISDPDSESPSGIIIFYGSSTDSPELPARIISNFRESDDEPYFEDALRAISQEVNCRVFIVHGHSEAKRRELKDFLKNELNLDPIVLMDEPDEGSTTIIEKFERYAPTCAYAIVILTPDDLIDKNGETYLQARPNVLIELGWFMAHLGRNKVLLLVQGDSKIPSDLSGILTKRFNRDVSEIGLYIKRELDQQNVNRK